MSIGNKPNLTGSGTAFCNGAITKLRVVASDGVDADGKPRIIQHAGAQSATLATVKMPIGVSKDTYADLALGEYYSGPPGSLIICEAGATVAADDYVMMDSVGRVITAAPTGGQYCAIVGRAVKGSTVGLDITVVWQPQIIGKN